MVHVAERREIREPVLTILKLLFALVLVYVIVVGALYLFQRRILFVPGTAPPDRLEAGLTAMSEVDLRTEDGLTLRSWYHKAAPGRPTIVYFQGNAGTIEGRDFKARPMIKAGLGVLLVGYRGYGGNPGHPSETGLIADGRAAIDFLKGEGVPAGDTVLYGESLGSGVAVALAAQVEEQGGPRFGAVILEAPYTSIVEIAAARYRFAPVDWLIKDRFDTLFRIARVTAPLLVLHGEKDRLIDASYGRRVFTVANDPKELRLFPEGRHSDLFDHGALEAVLGFLDRMWVPAHR
jgi:fermentation-respiration switch protein FrsA (DUF1100 family)